MSWLYLVISPPFFLSHRKHNFNYFPSHVWVSLCLICYVVSQEHAVYFSKLELKHVLHCMIWFPSLNRLVYLIAIYTLCFKIKVRVILKVDTKVGLKIVRENLIESHKVCHYSCGNFYPSWLFELTSLVKNLIISKLLRLGYSEKYLCVSRSFKQRDTYLILQII